MSYAIFRSKGIKTLNDLSQIGSHNQRTKDYYKSNPDIRIEDSKNNIELISCDKKYINKFYEITKDYQKEFNDRMKTIRSDRKKSFYEFVNNSKGVVADEMIFTSDEEFFKNMSHEDMMKWANESINFVIEDLGYKKEQIHHATLHLDEKVGIGIDEEISSKIPTEIALRNLAIGQADIEFTPLQINQLTQIIANNGTYKPLYIYDSIINNDKSIIESFKSSKSEEIISPYIITQIKEIMESVSEYGTAKELSDLEGGCGVKTGTAQSNINGVSINHGWITGFYPQEEAKYAITILVEGKNDKSMSATPIFETICHKINKEYF